MPQDKWRKSDQWFGLKRAHAEIVAQESHPLWQYITDKCPMTNMDSEGNEKWCILDEHYPAIALAMADKDMETDCYGHLHFTEWQDRGTVWGKA